jgi:hypothetical protein
MFAAGRRALRGANPAAKQEVAAVKLKFSLALVALAVGLIASPLGANPNVPHVSNWAVTDNLTALGYSDRTIPLANSVPGAGVFNSDLAFQDDMVVQGTYGGFRLIDVTFPSRPKEIIDWDECASGTSTTGNQGDVIVWNDLVIRSWNSPAPTAGSMCGDMPVAAGQEGIHVIDISNPREPDVVAFVDLLCGSHTETLVPDLANNRLLVYSNSSAGTFLGSPNPPDPHQPDSCRGFDIVEIPLSDPSDAAFVRFVPAGDPTEPAEQHHPCHDTGVILGDAMMVACAGSNDATGPTGEGPGAAFYTIDPAKGGAKDNPKFLFYKVTGGISLGHSASFTYDGKIAIIGHEPGGGSGANCEATDNPLERTFFFVDTATGASVGQFTIPRPQTSTENCTTHNYNVVPLKNKNGKPRYVMVSGNYQSGISVIDFSDPANAREIAYADPPPLINPDPSPTGIELGGDWSTYWYNGRLYESDITRGLVIWRLDDPAVNTYLRTSGPNNPQTQLFTIDK